VALRTSSESRRRSSASKLHQVEGVEEHAPIVTPIAQAIENRQAVIAAGQGLPIDEA
jgi:hypothetical protein